MTSAVAERAVPGETPTLPKFEWDGWDLVREVDAEGTETVYYAPLGEILSFKREDDIYQVHRDALGSFRSVSNADGISVASFDLDAWGSILASSGSLANVPYIFVGALGVRLDSTTNLAYMRKRWYSSELQVFISRDPVGILARNLYRYSRNNPTSRIDPFGLRDVVVVHYDPASESSVDWAGVEAKLESQFGFDVRLERGLTKSPGFRKCPESDDPCKEYHVNVDFDFVSAYQSEAGTRFGYTPPVGYIAGNPAGPESIIYPYNIERGVRGSQTIQELIAATPPSQRSAKLREFLRNFYTNTVLHELGHALSGSGSEYLGRRDDATVMNYGLLASPAPLCTGLLPYDPTRIQLINQHIIEGVVP